MKRSHAWWAFAIAALFAFPLAGCGSKEAPVDETAAVEATPEEAPPEMPVPEPVAEPVAETPAATPSPSGKVTAPNDIGATDEMLKLAQSDTPPPASGSQGAPSGMTGSNPSSAGGSYPGAGGPSTAGGSYPGAGGPSTAGGSYPGAGGPSTAGGSYPGMPGRSGPINAGGAYPGASGPSGANGANSAGVGYPGASGPSGANGANSAGTPNYSSYTGGSATGAPGTGAITPPGAPGAGMPSASTPGGGNSNSSPSIEAAEKFLDALKEKDLEKLKDAIALRAPLQATPKHRPIFANIRDGQLDEATLAEMSEAFAEMKVTDMNTPKSTGLRGVIVSKTEKDQNEMVSRTIYIKREVAGWKVLDFSGPRIRSGYSTGSRKQR